MNTLQDHFDPRFDTDLIDRIRQQEANAQAALDVPKSLSVTLPLPSYGYAKDVSNW